MSQTLVMTPRLQQAIKLLQYNHLEMVDHIQEQILENPTLEVVPDTDTGNVSDRERELLGNAQKSEQDVVDQRNGDEGNIDWEKLLNQMSLERGRGQTTTGGTIFDDLPPIETNLTYGESLADHLIWQLTMLRCSETEERVARAIAHNLDYRGYLEATEAEIIKAEKVTEEDFADALEIIHSLDPFGCGARDLSECLILQSKLHFPEDDMFPLILSPKHLRNLERRNYQAIARDLGLDVEDVIEYHRMVQDFEPHPGRAFSDDDARYITPDLYVDMRSGEWVILLNEDGMPDLRISRYYQKVLTEASKTDKEYLLDKLRGAEFLIKSINKRRKTIRRVMDSILKFQREFFDGGVQHLRPLVLQDVADDIGVHMSTVSRVTTNKYVHTPHGIFELKYFFSAGVKQQSGGDMASEAIKSRIKALVQNENQKKPLSDQAIANKLKEVGIRVARRTVAKYREAMGILPSSKRKQMF
ncbi:MAG: RNA polymerase factor sigma-54 [Proteobacteria bacterium]|nr:RNA polymerase factor sigma-54 [Pseudomonadota bacterium]